MKKNNNIIKFRNLINEKKKKSKNIVIQNKKNHIKRNILYNKRNIISNIPSNLLHPLNLSKLLVKLNTTSLQILKENTKKNFYIIFRIKNNNFQYNLINSFQFKSLVKKKGIKIKILEKTFKELEKEINKIAKIYSLKTIFFNNPLKITTKKGILIRMGKGKGKIIEKYKIVERNKIFLIMTSTKEMKYKNIYLLTQVLSNLNKKYPFLSKFHIS